MTIKKEPKKIAVLVFGNDLHVSVTMLSLHFSNEQIVRTVKKAIIAFQTEPVDKKVIIRFWDMAEDQPLLSFEWHMHHHSNALHYCWENQESLDLLDYQPYRKTAWDIVDAIGYGIELSEAPHDPLQRNHRKELRSSNEQVERRIRYEFGNGG